MRHANPSVRRLASVALLASLLLSLIAGPATSQEPPEIPEDEGDVLDLVVEALGLAPDDLPDPVDQTDPFNPSCDPLDTGMCLFPFPSNQWTTPDDTTATGLRVNLPLEAMPRNVLGKPVVPDEWNRNDGFSPGSLLITHVPGLDLAQTWGLADLPARYQQQITDLALSTGDESPIVIVDADTGKRHPFFSEMDTHVGTPEGNDTLLIRPAINFLEGHRYVIGMRGLRDESGGLLTAGDAFAGIRDGSDSSDRATRYDSEVFPALAAAGVERDSLYLAWDFTIASADSLAGRVLHMRDESFAALGDTDLANGLVEGDSPAFTVDAVEPNDDPEHDTLRVVRGTITVPNYLTYPDSLAVPVEGVGTFPPPGDRLYYGTPIPGPGDLPTVNPLAPTRDVEFVCSVPRTTQTNGPAVPTLYGHGLLGSMNESSGSSTERMRESNYMPCAVDWLGMATGDILNVANILSDVSTFGSLADRTQQGFLNFLFLGRALSHPQGLASDPAFHDEAGDPIFDTDALVYDGNSQGGIMGGALTALGVDFERAVLGVPGINYSTLLNRSVDWEGAYGEVLYAFYPNKMEQQLGFALIQMLWDRGEGNGYAHHMTGDPYPNTPAHQVLLHPAFGDHQVTNHAAEVEARTIGARRVPTDIPACRHWSLDLMYGFEPNDPTQQHPAVLAYYDSGTPTPPNGNNPPEGLGEDPHSDPRKDPNGIIQKVTFYETGRVIDPFAGAHAMTDRWPERAGDDFALVEPQLTGDCRAAASDTSPTDVAGPIVDPEPVAPAETPLPATGGGFAIAGLLALGALPSLRGRTRSGQRCSQRASE